MAYWFAGFFVRPTLERPAVLPGTVVWREIVAPFVGVGVRLPGLTQDKPGPDEAWRLLAEVGLGGSTDWLYLNYVTWAGRIDSVYGLGAASGREFGPASESGVDKARAAYLGLMGWFGVAPADALRFPPFARGFWGE